MLAVDLYCLGIRQAIVRPTKNEMPVTRVSSFRCFHSNERRVAQCDAGAFLLFTSGEEIIVLISSPNVAGK